MGFRHDYDSKLQVLKGINNMVGPRKALRSFSFEEQESRKKSVPMLSWIRIVAHNTENSEVLAT
jgi:hypothetical protein